MAAEQCPRSRVSSDTRTPPQLKMSAIGVESVRSGKTNDASWVSHAHPNLCYLYRRYPIDDRRDRMGSGWIEMSTC